MNEGEHECQSEAVSSHDNEYENSVWEDDDSMPKSSCIEDENEDCDAIHYDVDDSTDALLDTVLDIEKNDPDFTSLSIAWTTDDAAYDWERIGRVIGHNSHMERLRLYFLNYSFLQGIVRKRSLVHLHISECEVYQGEEFTYLGSFSSTTKTLDALLLAAVTQVFIALVV